MFCDTCCQFLRVWSRLCFSFPNLWTFPTPHEGEKNGQWKWALQCPYMNFSPLLPPARSEEAVVSCSVVRVRTCTRENQKCASTPSARRSWECSATITALPTSQIWRICAGSRTSERSAYRTLNSSVWKQLRRSSILTKPPDSAWLQDKDKDKVRSDLLSLIPTWNSVMIQGCDDGSKSDGALWWERNNVCDVVFFCKWRAISICRIGSGVWFVPLVQRLYGWVWSGLYHTSLLRSLTACSACLRDLWTTPDSWEGWWWWGGFINMAEPQIIELAFLFTELSRSQTLYIAHST